MSLPTPKRSKQHWQGRNASCMVYNRQALQRPSSKPVTSRCAAATQQPSPQAALDGAAQQRIAAAQQRKARLTDALQNGLRVVVDCSYITDGRQQQQQQQQGSIVQPSPPQSSRHQPAMPTQSPQLVTGVHIDKETRSLAKQIELSAAFNKRSPQPVALTVTSFTGPLEAFANHMGAAAWPINKHHHHVLELYAADQLVLLSPDAEAALLSLDASKVYVVGGIVDKTVQKGMTIGFAQDHGLAACRLPIKEHAQQLGLGFPGASTRPILSVTDVVIALVEFNRLGDWEQALLAALPSRRRRQH